MRINTDTTFDLGQRHVGGLPILVSRRFPQESLQSVIAHPPGTLRRADAGLLDGPADGLRQTSVDGWRPRAVTPGGRLCRTRQDGNNRYTPLRAAPLRSHRRPGAERKTRGST